jgi:hypothetical protein
LLVAEVREAGHELTHANDLVGLERQIVLQQIRVTRRQGCDSQIRHTVREVIVCTSGFASLELRVQRQRGQPGFRRIAEGSNRRACVRE